MKDKINRDNLPRHIAVIMDGNGRWAKRQGAMRIFGHQNAIEAVRNVSEVCAELGVEYLTLYAFSTENWNRPKEEVEGLMALLVGTIKAELDTLHKNNIRLATIGHTHSLPTSCQQELQEAIAATAHHDGLTLTLALSYSGRWELTEAVKSIAHKVKEGKIDPEQVDEALIHEHLATRHMPDPELLIRTSGELRVSNFLLWQIAYTELYVTDILWPDFKKDDLYEAILAFQKRERRFGKISEQLKSQLSQ